MTEMQIFTPALGSRIGITPIGDQTIGPRRYISAALNSKEVGPVDLLLLSHAHTDHFDYPTLRQLQSPNTIAVTAKNTTPLWQGMKFQSIEEMYWGDSKSLASVNVKAIEGKHWGARLPWDKGMEANSLLLSKNGVNILFGGDTGYTDLIKQQLNGIPIDLAIMGIAAYSPKSFESIDMPLRNKHGKWLRRCLPNGSFQCTGELLNYPMSLWKNQSPASVRLQPVKWKRWLSRKLELRGYCHIELIYILIYCRRVARPTSKASYDNSDIGSL